MKGADNSEAYKQLGDWKPLFSGLSISNYENPKQHNFDLYKARLKELREGNGYTKSYLGRVLGITCQGYTNIEVGRRKKISVEQLYKLASLLYTTPDYLFGRTDKVSAVIIDGKERTLPMAWRPSLVAQDQYDKIIRHLTFLRGQDKEIFDILLGVLTLEEKKYAAVKVIMKAVVIDLLA